MSRRQPPTFIALSILFLATWIPRLLVLDTFVTADERKWVNRSGNFYWALSEGEWAETFQKAHPGVIVTWTGLIAFVQAFPGYLQRVSQPISDNALENLLWQEGPLSPLAMLATGRWWMVLFISLTVTAMYLPLRRLYGPLTAIVAVFFVAWSPFFLGLSHHLHPDGPLAAFSVLSILLFLAWLYADGQWRYLVASGILFGLALLTKTPAVAVGLAAGLMVIVETKRRWRKRHDSLPALWAGVIAWGLIALATFVLLWPVMWVDPLGAMRMIYEQMQGYRIEGHSLPSFFLGQVVDDPGWRFYPMVLWLRISPVTLVGLGLAVWIFIGRLIPLDRPAARWATVGTLVFVLCTVILAAVSAKKFDRYILPAFLALDMVAAAGWVGLVNFLAEQWRVREGPVRSHGGLRNWLGGSLLAMLVVAQGLPAFLHYPYYALAFNPLAGGSRVAKDVLMIGWGEGLDEVGRWLSAQVADEPLRVVSWYEHGPLSYFLPGDSQLMSFIESENYWFDADYVVLYANQWQRENPDPEMVRHFLDREPVFAVERNGLELAKVYDNRAEPPPPFTHIYIDSQARFDHTIELAAYRLANPSLSPGDSFDITLFLQPIQPVDEVYVALAELADPEGQIVWQEERWPSGESTVGWPLGEIRQDRYAVTIPGDAKIGPYAFRLALLDADGTALSVQGDQVLHGETVHVAEVVVQAPEPVFIDAWWEGAAITQLAHASSVSPGQTLLVDLAIADVTNDSVKASLRLIDPQGTTQAQQDKDLAADLRFELSLPDSAPQGTYELSIVLYDGQTFETYPDQHGASPTTISTVSVTR